MSTSPANQAPSHRAIPKLLNFPAELPVVERRAEIAEAISHHQVVIIAGETGSGKNHPASQDLPGARSWSQRSHRAYPAKAIGGQKRGPANRR